MLGKAPLLDVDLNVRSENDPLALSLKFGLGSERFLGAEFTLLTTTNMDLNVS